METVRIWDPGWKKSDLFLAVSVQQCCGTTRTRTAGTVTFPLVEPESKCITVPDPASILLLCG
jgi:hypothetical protein